MKNHPSRRAPGWVIALLLGLAALAQAYSPQPDLTAAGAIAALKVDPNASRLYTETYNLGPTGLRGWIYIDSANAGQQGLITAPSRQILITVASAPGSAVLAVDDVILGAMAGSSGTVPVFTSDCRKAFGVAIGDAEKTGAGTLRVKRWRAGVTTDVNIAMTIMGDYTATAPYSCPKSALILANARVKLVNDLLADPNFLNNGYGGAIDALALLACVAPGDANYATVQTRLQTFAQGLAPANLTLTGCDTWNWSYINIFLCEYYLRTVADGAPDASVLSGINKYTVALAKGQSKYGTFGHGGAETHADGSLHGSISWYGPVNAAGIPANVAIVMGKKVLVASGGAVDAEIDPAIERASNFFGSYVNKGPIPYGEHEPYADGHASNGKDPMCAVLFGLQASRPVEAEYFTRMTVAGCTGREYGHTGQGFSYLWGAMGANMGGPTAVAKYLENIRWHLDLERRTDGSFVYDGAEQYGAGSTADGTYLGACGYNDVSPTSSYILSFAVSLQRLYITGRNAIPANTLSAAKVTNAMAAATFKQDCTAYTVAQLMTALSEYDPVVRLYAATELAASSRPAGSMTTTDENNLIALITNGTMSTDANVRQGACQTLGIRKPTSALTALGQRLSDSDLWVRGQAAKALKNFGSAANPQLTPMLTAFAANATDPDVIVWTDPLQISNGYLADALFQGLPTYTIAAGSSLLWPAVRAGLKQPDGMARGYLGDFIKTRLTLADVQAVGPSIVEAAAKRSPADQMFSDGIRYAALNTLGKYKIEEGIPLCLMVKEQTWHGDDWDPFTLLQNTYRGAAKDALPTLYKWQAHLPQFAADPSVNTGTRLADITAKIASTIAAIKNDNAPPTLTYFKSLTASASPAAVTLPVASTTVSAVLTDVDTGVPNFIWSKVNGAGAVAFNPTGTTANTSSSAAFTTPGTYVLRATALDRSILDYKIWITYNLGYFDFQTYNETLGAVTKDVTVTVSPDPNRAPVPLNQTLITALNTVMPITLAATDADGDTMTYAVVTAPTHGALSGTAPNVVYTPTTGYTGLDSFTFKANDGKVDSAVATITIDVGVAGNRRPVAANQLVTTPEDTAKTITLTGSDPDGNPLTYDLVTGPIHGTLTGTAPNLTYLPAANYPAGNFNGADSFTFTVRDASLTSAVATVSITVTPVNDPPQATAQSVNASVNVANPITLAGTDPEGYALLYTVVTNPTHGTLLGTAPSLTYQPTANYHGADSFTFKVTDSEGVLSSSATVSINVINDPPVANAQSVELQPNTSKAITLTGSDNTNDALTYTVLTQPANGGLSGTAPNVTYTPTANYTGADSFTFRANDGVNNSPAAVVSLNVVQFQTWTNIAAGTWSTGANWTGGVAPTAGGSTTGLLVFNTSTYSGISSNDLAGTFQLNRMNLGNVLPAVTISGNPLSFTLNSATLPQINQDSPNDVTVSNNLALAAGTTVGGTGAGALTLSGIISGANSLTKTSSGNLTLSGVNTYSAGTIVNSGTFTIGNKNGCGTGSITLAAGTTFQQANFEGNTSAGALPNGLVLSGSGNVVFNIPFGGGKDIWLSQPVSGTGGITVQGGDRSLTLTASNSFSGGITLGDYNNRVVISHLSALGTGTFRSERTTAATGRLETAAALTAGSGVANAFDIAFGSYLNVYANGSNHLLLSGPITSAGGTGNLYKDGTATLTLSGVNTYTGTTTVAAGILACSSATALGQGPVAISNGATLNLNFTGTRYITSLAFAGTAQANGTYSSATSPTFISGTGTLTVAPATTTALAITGGVTPSYLGDALTFTATVTGSTPTGNVAFYAGATLLGTSALNGLFQASFTTSSLAAGSYNITAQYVGNASNASSTSAVLAIQVVGIPAPPTNLVATPGNNTVGLTWTASIGATGYNAKRSLTNGGSYTALGTASGTSYADNTAVNGTTYYYVVSATNGSGESANSAQVTVIPSAASSTTTLTSSSGATGVYGSAVTFTATVAVTAGPATGTVTFKDGTTVLGTGTLSSGATTFVTSTLAPGSHSITATYGGDSTFTTSVSSAFAYSVSAKPVTITGVTAGNKAYDGTTTATLTGGTLSGVVNGDTVTLLAGTGAFSSANAGTWAVTASGYALGGANAGNYSLSAQPTVPNATITARTIQLTGTRGYDGTAAAAAGILSISNNLDAGNLTLTGSANLAGKDVGSQAIIAGYATPVRVRSATGFSAASSSTSFTVTMGAAPANGNTLIAVISTRGSAANQITGIVSTGATWSRVAQSTNASGSTTEIWSAPVGASAATGVTISTVAGRCAGVVIEYSGVLTTASPVDQTAVSSNTGTAAVTGTTVATTQANELWIGGIGYRSSAPTLNTLLNSFTSVASAQSGSNTAGNNAMVYALESIVSATGTAGSGGTLTASVAWSGAIATFKTATTSGLSLAGSASANYTLTGATGTVQITTKALTVSSLAASGRPYDGTSVATLSGTAALLTAEAAGAGTTSDGKPYTGDTVALGGTAAGTFADPNVGTAKVVTLTGLTLTGAGSGNYTIMQPAGLTADITTRSLTVTASNQSKTYGQTVTFGSGSIQFTSSGLQNGETIGSVTLACSGGVAAAAVASYPITPSAATGGTFAAGNYTLQYVAGTFTVNMAPFDAWAADSAQGLTAGVNNGPLDDPDRDGISNLLEFALGGAPMVSSRTILPTLTSNGNNWLFEYNRSDLSISPATTQVVEYGSDLAGWTAVTIPATSAGSVTITGSSPSHHVTVTIPSPGAKGFVRLKVTK